MLSFQPLGDTGVRIGMGDEIRPDINRRIRSYCNALEKNEIHGVSEWVPAYCSVTVYYRPHLIGYDELCRRLEALAERVEETSEADSRVWVLPVAYGGECGPDLEDVASRNGLSASEVIRIHSRSLYRVYMMGFVPGFPYLGGMSDSIAAPRLSNPRPRIPAGSVGIAGSQTGVYPLETPGGWRLIGRTPVRLYDPDRERPMLLQAGDSIRFQPVDSEEYREIRERLNRGEYTIRHQSNGEIQS
ncbi:5-oxoprolinase subunit PxpB [Paludifilum halophilum]|uniref:Allophanate hydrolase n=1 Tax=Paludifilum halophilum TaxID=1642702 RepID=A0A235B3C0_9BACL|nr:5-oxoprolinase subunit PxpB [Paludifilum halophilum]OYD06732.1 allophanate hydrolase [Paludifilum halophilum]